MAIEYCLTYTYTGRSNESTNNATPIVDKSKFSLTGDTDKRIGRITKIVYGHYHTSTNPPATWELKGRLHFSDGSYIDSDIVSHKFSGDIYCYTNTFTENLPSQSRFDTWTKIETVKVNTISGAELYWRALSSYPMTVKVYFVDAGFVHYGVDGAWKECEMYYGVDGAWKQVTPYYGIDEVWKST